jgi:UPF0271 protein
MIKNKISIDFNADLGEGIPHEKELMAYLNSCNIACGGHFGDKQTITDTLFAAKFHRLKIGAHPSYPDKENFGRVIQNIEKKVLYQSLLDQLLLFKEICDSLEIPIHHIKPHGALYNQAAIDEEITQTILDIMEDYFPGVMLMGLPKSITEKLAKQREFGFIKEAFADRQYQDNGLLVPRSESGSVLCNNQEVFQQVRNIIFNKKIITRSGNEIFMEADSICFHGDNQNALSYLKFTSTQINHHASY